MLAPSFVNRNSRKIIGFAAMYQLLGVFSLGFVEWITNIIGVTSRSQLELLFIVIVACWVFMPPFLVILTKKIDGQSVTISSAIRNVLRAFAIVIVAAVFLRLSTLGGPNSGFVVFGLLAQIIWFVSLAFSAWAFVLVLRGELHARKEK